MAMPKPSSSSSAAARRRKKGDTPGWVAPAAIGGGLLAVGLALFSRKAKAAPGDLPERSMTDRSKTSDDSRVPESSPEDSSEQDPTPDHDIVFPIYSGDEGRKKLWDIADAAGLDDDWIRFFLLTASGESAFTSNVVLGDRSLYPTGSKPSPQTDALGVGEAAGARRAYDRGLEEGRYINCTWPKSAYCWGSGGWLQMLPANAWAAYDKTGLRCRHPWYLLHPVDHVVTAIEFARRLTTWSAFKDNPTWLTLRVGWGNPSAMDEPSAHQTMAKKLAKHRQSLGILESWLGKKVTTLPHDDVEQRWESLMNRFEYDPDKKGV